MRPKLNIREEVEQLFEKKFQYQKPRNEAWLLPAHKPLFSEFYQYESLQELKQQLNNVKSKLNNYGVQEWSTHTNRRDPSGEISWRLKNETKAEFVTVAWCKFFECLHRYPLIKQPELNTLHLCEAPGAFIAALNHYLHSTYTKEEINWHWRSTTLNPYYEGNALNEMITDDRFIFHTLNNWLFHRDFTGNLLNVENIEHMRDVCAKDLPAGVQLITADGSIDCSAQPDCQEEIVARLLFAEILSALHILSPSGNLVIKMFTLFEACSVSIMFMLNCIFERVHIFKPATSKRGNSEVYVICLNYQKDMPGLSHLLEAMRSRLAQPNDTMVMPLFAKSQIPNDFLMQHNIVCRLFLKLQEEAIESSIYAYESKDRYYLRHLHQLRGVVSSMYYNRYKVRPLPEELCIVQQADINKALGFSVPVYGGSYTEREHLRQGDVLKQIYCLRREFNQLEKCPTGLRSYSHVKLHAKQLQLQPCRGAPIGQLLSSLFASEPVLLLRLRILQTFDLDPLWQTAAKCSLCDGNNHIMRAFDYAPDSPADESTFYKVQRRFFVALVDSLLEQRPAKIVFQAFLFLSHYAASVLLLMAEQIYEETLFENQIITLSGLSTEPKALEQLQQLQRLLREDVTDGLDTLHSLLPLQQLHKNPFASALILYNNTVLVSCYRRMLGEEAFPTRFSLEQEQEAATPAINETATIVC
ncbi:PREDICTED: cap-specific mRNA (nucleoside-2'-O-)-methyltransferase 2 [Drosophila arizonae]|uniref:Cap-specific mRNA (nucleoside-2'-O-)-methyltransferase 2 n=1 Tax=Drosophila arizonae TaxID=7263 RepID=A0ABM1PIY3_DROAR|nr:PREDICTED: cap-specific mRNA (nucleoside-2'-O-)-methyltransferase 2 [Drosophila arizonae]